MLNIRPLAWSHAGASPRLEVFECWSWALGIVAVQIFLALLGAPDVADPKATYHSVRFPDEWKTNPPDFTGLVGRYRRLNEWDSLHYLSIAAYGYRRASSPPLEENIHSYRDNQAFFPGFPILARAFARVTGLSPEVALPMTAQIFAVFSWLFLFLLMREFFVPRQRAIHGAIAFFCFPTSFYLVAPYSESVFTTAMLAWIYGSIRIAQHPGFVALALPSGFLLTATRIVGVPLVVLPWLLPPGKDRPRWATRTLLVLVASLGVVSYFAYLQWKFGDWKLHFLVQKTGWRNTADLFWFLKPHMFFPNILRDTWFNNVSRVCVPIFSIFLAKAWWDLWQSPHLENKRVRFSLLYAASALFFIPCAAKAGTVTHGMIRYVLPVYLLLILNRLLDPSSRWPRSRFDYRYVLMFGLQLVFLYRFLHGNGVS